MDRKDTALPHAQVGAVTLYDDADAQLNLRVDISDARDFVLNQSALTKARHDELVRKLGLSKLGAPRSLPHIPGDDGNCSACKCARTDRHWNAGCKRYATAEELGIAHSPAGQVIMDPDDPTLEDRDVDAVIYGKSPNEIIAAMDARETQDGIGMDFWASMLQRDVKIETHGGGSRSRPKPRAHGASQVDRAAIHSVAGSLA